MATGCGDQENLLLQSSDEKGERGSAQSEDKAEMARASLAWNQRQPQLAAMFPQLRPRPARPRPTALQKPARAPLASTLARRTPQQCAPQRRGWPRVTRPPPSPA